MGIKKILFTLAVLALALMGLAPSAFAAEDGTMVDVETGEPIPAERELHFIGWTEWGNASGDGFVCHVTYVVKMTDDTTGQITTIKIPDTTKCKGTNAFAQCKLKGHEATNLPYHATVTPPDEATPAGQIDVTGNINVHSKLEGFLCPLEITWTLNEITWKPLETGGEAITGTAGKAGKENIAEASDPIAGFELNGEGESHSALGTDVVSFTGELELTEADLCTWEII